MNESKDLASCFAISSVNDERVEGLRLYFAIFSVRTKEITYRRRRGSKNEGAFGSYYGMGLESGMKLRWYVFGT